VTAGDEDDLIIGRPRLTLVEGRRAAEPIAMAFVEAGLIISMGRGPGISPGAMPGDRPFAGVEERTA
jgi:hypothetical protein